MHGSVQQIALALISSLPWLSPSSVVGSEGGISGINSSRAASAQWCHPCWSPQEVSPTVPTMQGHCEQRNLRLVHLWEPGALLQPWQHCPPQTLTLKQIKTAEFSSSNPLFQRTQASRGLLQAQPPASTFLWLPES